MSMGRLGQLFNPASVAIVGASPRPGSSDGIILKGTCTTGHGGRLDAVNPNRDVVDSVACAPFLTVLADPPDLAIVAAPPYAVEDLVRHAVAAKAKSAIILAAGLAAGQAPLLITFTRSPTMRAFGS